MVSTRGSKRRVEEGKEAFTVKQQKEDTFNCVFCLPSKLNTMSMSKRRTDGVVNVVQPQKRRFTVPSQQFTRRKPRSRNNFQTDGVKRILTGTNETDRAVRYQASKLEQQTDAETLPLTHPTTNSVSIQQKTSQRLENDQASGLYVHGTANDLMFQASPMPVYTSQGAEMEVSHEVNPTSNVIVRDEKTLSMTPGPQGSGQIHMSMTLNPCIEALNCNLTSPAVVPSNVVSANREMEDQISHTMERAATITLNLTEFAEQNGGDDFSDIDSLIGETSLVSVRGYLVKPENATFLFSILSKHGDICANCSLSSVSVRSFFMEKLCDILQKLTNTSIGVITEHELEDMRASVGDLGNANVEVGWLKNRLDLINDAKKVIPHLRPNSSLKLQHDENKKRLGQMKAQLEGYKKSFAAKQAEALDLWNKIYAAQSDISVTENKLLETEVVVSESRAKLKEVVDLGLLVSGLI